jgi:hypothetical protein
MMRTARAALATALILLAPWSASSQDDVRELKGELYLLRDDGQDPEPLPNVLITARESGASGLTSDQGVFRIRLPRALRPGRIVTLRHDKAGHAICFPLFGELKVPTDPADVVVVQFLPRGSSLFWADDRQIKAFLIRIADKSATQLKSPHGARVDFPPYVLELAEYYGFEKDEVTRQIQRWVDAGLKDPTDFHTLGLKAFARQNFGEAKRHFVEQAVRLEEPGLRRLREAARERALAGDSS